MPQQPSDSWAQRGLWVVIALLVVALGLLILPEPKGGIALRFFSQINVGLAVLALALTVAAVVRKALLRTRRSSSGNR
jgi:carbon starvation protein CstA